MKMKFFFQCILSFVSDRLWQIELTLTSEDDHQLHLLTDRIRTETGTGQSWIRLGVLLIKIGPFDKAEDFYMSLFDQTTDEMEKIMSYNQLGLIKQEKGEYRQAISLCSNKHWTFPGNSFRKTILIERRCMEILR